MDSIYPTNNTNNLDNQSLISSPIQAPSDNFVSKDNAQSFVPESFDELWGCDDLRYSFIAS